MWYLGFLLLLLHPPLSVQRPVRAAPSKLRTEDVNGKTSGAGEECGVYTFRCGPGLKCAPPKGDPRPLRALLEGRGRCGHEDLINATQASRAADPAPTEASEQAPCRKLLTELLAALGPRLLRPRQEVYLPNCDRRGFFKRRQCWSSRGRQRGRCWCVDEDGAALASNSTQTSAEC